jgi:hypothetical protein
MPLVRHDEENASTPSIVIRSNDPPLHVMISSTTVDLPEHRHETKEAILRVGHNPVMMEHGSAEWNSDAIKFSLQKVEKAQVYIGIFALRYGFIPDDPIRNPNRLSITEMEYRHAQKLGIPTLIYIAKKSHPFEEEQIDFEPEKREKLKRLKDELCQGIVGFFEDPKDLRSLVQQSLSELRIERNSADQASTISPEPSKPRCSEFTSIGSLFMGRAEDMEKLRASLRKEHARATAIVASQVIHGQGGIGKTRLAVEFGLANAENYTALLFVAADSPQVFEANLAKLAGPLVLNLLPEDAKDDVKLAAVLQWLRSHPGYFLILDNVDSDEAAQAVEEKLALLIAGHVVITSRITQWSASVEPLQLDVLSEDAATAFLLKATERKAGSGRIITPTDEADARLLAKDVDGLALALEQSAAFIRTTQTTFAKYRQKWKAFDLKVRDFKDKRLMKYERSVLTTWQTTFDQLQADAVNLLRVCSLLAPAPIPLHLLESIETNYEDNLAELVKFSLATRSDNGETVRVHKVIQEIVVFRMDESDQQRIIQQVLDALGSLFSDTSDHTRMPQRSAVLAHVDAVVVHADRFSRLVESSAIVRADVAVHQWLIGQLSPALVHINASIEWGLKQSPVDERSVAIDRATRADIRRDQGDLAGALADISYSIEWGLKQSPVDERGVAIWRATRASIRQYQGDLAGALEDISDSIEWDLKQSPLDERDVAIWRGTRASILWLQGDLAGALEDISYSIEWGLKQSPVDERGAAIRRATRASIRQDQGDLAGALADISYSIEWGLKQSPVDERSVAIWRATRASIRRDQGDLAGALEDITYSIEWGLKQSPVDERSVAILRATRASIQQAQGDLAGALADITYSIEWEENQLSPNNRELAIRRATRASIRRDQGDLAGALADIDLALSWYEANLPGDTRTIGLMKDIHDSIG